MWYQGWNRRHSFICSFIQHTFIEFGHVGWTYRLATQVKNSISSALSENKRSTKRKEEICNILISIL